MNVSKVVNFFFLTFFVITIGIVATGFYFQSGVIPQLKEEVRQEVESKYPQYKPFTADEVIVGINEYRSSVGRSEVVLHKELCNDLVSRFAQQRDSLNSGGWVDHSGLEDWLAFVNSASTGVWNISELVGYTTDVEHLISGFKESPGHRLALEDDYKNVCVYTAQFIDGQLTVIILGSKDSKKLAQ